MLFKYGLLFAAMCLGADLAKITRSNSNKMQKSEVTPQEVGSIQLPDCDCPRKGDRVCGSDENTYANACFLECARDSTPLLDLSKEGPCGESETDRAKKSQTDLGLEDCIKKGGKCLNMNPPIPSILSTPDAA